MKRSLVVGLILWLGGWHLWGEVTFSNLHLGEHNLLLFQADVEGPGQEKFSTLFLSDIRTQSITPLTFYPENLQYLAQIGQLQIQNRFGVFRTNASLDPPTLVKEFPSFSSEGIIALGKLFPLQSSPDGRYLLYLEPTSPAYGNLMIVDLVEHRQEVVTQQIELTLSSPLVQWGPDSKYFIYTKGNQLYYFSIEQFQRNRLPAETLRTLGSGSIDSVQWGDKGELYYVEGTLVYRILQAELFARSLYQPLLRIGRIIGKIPFDFDPNFDRFWISPLGDTMILSVGGRNLFVYHLALDDFQGSSIPVHLPHLLLPRSFRVKDLVWSREDVVTILTEGIADGKPVTSLYRVDLRLETSTFTKLPDVGIRGISLSPDQEKIALMGEHGISIRDKTSWREERSIAIPKPLHVLWTQRNRLIIADPYRILQHNLEDNSQKLIGFSQPEEFGFQNDTVAVRTQNAMLGYLPASNQWSPLSTFQPEPAATASEDFRVFLESLPSGPLRNIVMVRDLKLPGTFPLFQPKSEPFEPLPVKDEPVNFQNFTHGSRIRSRVVSFVFNAIDSVEGLSEILKTLSDYDITATFFVNGEFIRRNPGAVKEIANSGHEVGSLFYTYFNLTDPRYRVTSDFIKQGLARNEDEYFQATGRELSLLWHTPYYIVRDDILAAGMEMNYTFVGRDVDSLDWAVKRTDAGLNPLYFPSADLIERILEQKKPGSIISFTVGKAENGQRGSWREDYLFHRLDLLVNRLLERGYRVVPVSVLMDLSR